MHRRAIISDIHGNLPALEAVLADIATQEVDEIVCLGDICGYGPQPVECIQRVRAAASWVLLGNHDEALFKEPLDFSRSAYDAIVWQRKIMDPTVAGPAARENWEWLQSLSPERTEKNVRFVHASPRDPIYEYVLKEDFDAASGGPTAAAQAMFGAVEWLCFCGHSHRPGVVSEDYRWWTPGELANGRSLLRQGFKTIVNAGSVGQPRDGNPDACYVLFDYDPPGGAPAAPAAAKPPGDPLQPNANTMVLPKQPAVALGQDDETRTETDKTLQEARDTVLLRSPKVLFRRVPYDVSEAQARFYAEPELPRHNAVRLAQGV